MAASTMGISSETSLPAYDPIERLSPRQRECLRHVYRLKTSKEIASDLGLGVGTVDSYLASAVSTLKARNRRHAAELLHAYEESQPSPRKFELENTGVAKNRGERTPIGTEGASHTWLQAPPFRTKGVPFNDLSPIFRLFWIIQLGIALAVGFGMLAVGLEVLSHLLR